jgi:hypothetical protein
MLKSDQDPDPHWLGYLDPDRIQVRTDIKRIRIRIETQCGSTTLLMSCTVQYRYTPPLFLGPLDLFA